MLLITDQITQIKKLESGLTKEGILDNKSKFITDGFSYWNTNTPGNLVVIFMFDASIKLLENIIKCINPAVSILVTSHHKFPQYINVVNIHSTDYIPEIIGYIKRFNPVEQSNLNHLKDDILIKINDKYKRIRFDDVDYIKADGKYVSLHIRERSFSIRTTLKEIMDILPNKFLRSHASYIVNIDKIESIQMHEQNIELEHINLPFSRKYKNSILERFHLG